MMRFLILYLFTFCIFTPTTAALHPNDFDWEIKKQRNGIKIYSADQHKETGIVPIKAQLTLNHSMPKILSVLANTKRKKEWIPKLEETFIVEQKSKYERIEYARYNSPWPFLDRTFVIATKGRINKKENSIFIDIHSVTHPKVPVNPKYIRGYTYLGSVYLKGLEKEKTFVEITLLTDFKGDIPIWIINLLQANWPFKMFTKLKTQLAKKDIEIWPEFKDYNP